jgi:hypothetical protein
MRHLHWLWVIPFVIFLTPIGWIITYCVTQSWLCVYINIGLAILIVILHDHYDRDREYEDTKW